jgi:hypothetical protein
MSQFIATMVLLAGLLANRFAILVAQTRISVS